MVSLCTKAVLLHALCMLSLTFVASDNGDEFLQNEDPLVQVKQGEVRGITATSVNGRLFYSFRGIPFAEPPTGELRFKAPVEAAAWDETFNATENPVRCPQAAGVLAVGDEDCLKLNVYTPSLPQDGAVNISLPVLVFIYGGGFVTGWSSSELYGPERYMDRDVVLVLMNYRVGPLGFFSTGDEAASGNWGLLDQNLALKWVQENIAAFGGDPTRVTIDGQSAGSASVMYHVVSPASQGLFRGAIAESGSSISLWALQRNPLKSAIKFGKQLDCPTNDTQLLVDCLREIDTKKLIDAAIVIGTYNYLQLPFLPVVENPETGLFLTDYPINILMNGDFNKVAILSGSNKEDGDLSYGFVPFAYDNIDETFFNSTLPALLYAYFKTTDNLIEVSYAIKGEYYDKIDVDNQTQVIRASIDFNTDAIFTAINDQTVHLLAEGGAPSVYTYVFGYPGSASKHNYTGETEVSHGDELPYMFYMPGTNFTDEDQVVSDRMIDMWVNFTTYLNPTPDEVDGFSWQQKTVEENNYLVIIDDFEMQLGYREEQMQFWNEHVPVIMSVYPVRVKIDGLGTIQGSASLSAKGRPFCSFRGIPYAEPPIGDLRFSAPVDANPWNGTFYANKNPAMCPQVSDLEVVGDEDCLKLNVYTPSLPANETDNPNLPVLVFIYGGSFVSGWASSDLYGPERYMDKDVVLVLMNYRLGPFGFLSTGDDAASGNWGLLDQTLALKWVQNNIAAFGGDPTKVTIDGQSAGAASVMYHVISPASKGLFRGAIAESGSSLSLWALQRKPYQSAVRFGRELDCHTDETQALVECLRKQSTSSLINAAKKLGAYNSLGSPFLPVVEDSKTGKFLTDYPIHILQNGTFNKVAIMSGTNKDDGDITYEMRKFAYDDIDDFFFNHTLPMILYSYFKYDSNLVNVSYAIKAMYYDKVNVKNESQAARASIDFNTDAVYTAINNQTIRLLAENGATSVFTYIFGYAGSASTHNYSGEIEVSHSDELPYLFYMPSYTFNDQDQLMSDTLIDLWVNFTTSLNPTPTDANGFTWKPKTSDNNNYLMITEDFTMGEGYRCDQMEFWNVEVPTIMGVYPQPLINSGATFQISPYMFLFSLTLCFYLML